MSVEVKKKTRGCVFLQEHLEWANETFDKNIQGQQLASSHQVYWTGCSRQFKDAFPNTDVDSKQLCTLWYTMGREGGRGAFAQNLDSDLLADAEVWAVNQWGLAMRQSPYLENFALHGGPFFVHAASCGPSQTEVRIEMATVFVKEDRGRCLRKLGSNDPLGVPELSDAVVFRLVLGSHENPMYRGALEALTHRVLTPIVHTTTMILGAAGPQAPGCVCVDFLRGPLCMGGLQIDSAQTTGSAGIGGKLQRSNDILATEQTSMGNVPWQEYTERCLLALRTNTSFSGDMPPHARPRCRAALTAPTPYVHQILRYLRGQANRPHKTTLCLSCVLCCDCGAEHNDVTAASACTTTTSSCGAAVPAARRPRSSLLPLDDHHKLGRCSRPGFSSSTATPPAPSSAPF